MKIEEGKFYKTRDGQKAGPAKRSESYWLLPINGGRKNGYRENGKWGSSDSYGDADNPLDLISEWTDEPTGPVRTVTLKEIVPGSYGNVKVGACTEKARVSVSIMKTSSELRAAAAILIEIADALEEQQ